MKVANKYIKQCKILIIFSLLIVLFLEKIVAMPMPPRAIRHAKAWIAKKRAREEAGEIVREPGVVEEDKYFLHPQDSEYGVIISKDALQKSDFLNSQVMDVPTMDRKIAIAKYSMEQIKSVCDVLKIFTADTMDEAIKRLESFINKFTFNNLIDLANLLNQFLVESDIIKVVLNKIEKDIVGEKNSFDLDSKFDSLKGLHPELQRLLMTNRCIKDLTMLIMERNEKNRVNLDEYVPRGAGYVAWNGGNTIIHGGKQLLELWDISNVNKITRQSLSRNYWINVLNINPAGTKIIAGHEHNLAVFDIKGLKITNTNSFVVDIPNIQTIVVSPDGAKVAIGGSNAQHLVLWNINNMNNPINLKNAPQEVRCITFSPNSNKLVAGGAGHHTDNLKLWDVSDISDKNKLENQEPQTLVGNEGGDIYAIAFNPAGDKIISGGENHLMLWDIAKPIITSQSFLSNDQKEGIIKFVAFSSDGNVIFVNNRIKRFGMTSGFLWLYDVDDLQNVRKKIRLKNSYAMIYKHDKILIDKETWIGQYLSLYIPVTEDQKKMIEDIKKCNSDQLQLLYELGMRSLKKDWRMSSKRREQLKEIKTTLPSKDMQTLLNELGFLKK